MNNNTDARARHCLRMHGEEKDEVEVYIDSRDITGWDKVEKLARALVDLRGLSVSSSQADEIMTASWSLISGRLSSSPVHCQLHEVALEEAISCWGRPHEEVCEHVIQLYIVSTIGEYLALVLNYLWLPTAWCNVFQRTLVYYIFRPYMCFPAPPIAG